MTSALLALAVAALLWPAARPVDLRVRRLVGATRLAAPPPTRSDRWRPTVSRRSATLLAVGSAAGLGFAWRGVVVGVLGALVAAGLLGWRARALGRRIAVARDRELSAALRILRAELDAGSRPDVALVAAAETGSAHRSAFQAAAQAVRAGTGVAAAVAACGAVPREVLLVGQAWDVSATTGAPLAAVLARIDDDAQARSAQRRAVASALSGPRSSAVLLAGLPVLGVLLGMAMGAHPLAVLLDSAAGQLLLCVGVLLDVAGMFWTARLISSAERS